MQAVKEKRGEKRAQNLKKLSRKWQLKEKKSKLNWKIMFGKGKKGQFMEWKKSKLRIFSKNLRIKWKFKFWKSNFWKKIGEKYNLWIIFKWNLGKKSKKNILKLK